MHQKINHFLRATVGDFQPHGFGKATRGEFTFQRAHQIFGFLFTDKQITVAGHPELVAAGYSHARKQVTGMLVNN